MKRKISIFSRLIILSSIVLMCGCTSGPVRGGYDSLKWPVTEAEFLAALPADIYPESMGRIPIVNRDDLDDERKKVYDSHASPNRTSRAGLQGPGGLTLNGSPDLSQTRVDPRTLELIRLVVSKEMKQVFEWTLHEPVALREGLEAEIIDVIRFGKPLQGVPEREAAIIQWIRELFQDRRVSSETFTRLIKQVNKRDLVDMVFFMGNYTRTALLLHTFDVYLPYDREPLLPPQ
jgi:4-carboxymuconolactone decarboxylase